MCLAFFCFLQNWRTYALQMLKHILFTGNRTLDNKSKQTIFDKKNSIVVKGLWLAIPWRVTLRIKYFLEWQSPTSFASISARFEHSFLFILRWRVRFISYRERLPTHRDFQYRDPVKQTQWCRKHITQLWKSWTVIKHIKWHAAIPIKWFVLLRIKLRWAIFDHAKPK